MSLNKLLDIIKDGYLYFVFMFMLDNKNIFNYDNFAENPQFALFLIKDNVDYNEIILLFVG